MSVSQFSLTFDGMDDYIEIPDSDDFSVSTTGSLTVSAWMRPDTLTFPKTEGSGYVHWMGKGEKGEQEWVFRMYSQGNTENRGNRISFYVFNLAGGLGVGSYFQDPITAGQWIHVVGVTDTQMTSIYKDGVLRKTDRYHGTITPEHGTAPLRIGTRDLNSFFQGSIRQVRVWNRALTGAEISDLYGSGTVPQDGMVAEYVLEQDSAVDSAGIHTGEIRGPTWVEDNG